MTCTRRTPVFNALTKLLNGVAILLLANGFVDPIGYPLGRREAFDQFLVVRPRNVGLFDELLQETREERKRRRARKESVRLSRYAATIAQCLTLTRRWYFVTRWRGLM